jgi:magnesium-transporting ATPase (P-type)
VDMQEPMSENARRAIGFYLVGVGLVMLVLVPWAWSVAWRANESETGDTSTSFLGLDFSVSAPATLLTIVVLMAAIGSVTVMTLVFAARAGHGTLEQTYLWWYVTRPVSAAGIGVLVYMFIVAGFFDFAKIEDGSTPALVIAAAVGALAGLFTDQVLDRVRWVLGLSAFDSGTARRRDPSDVGLSLLDQDTRVEDVDEPADRVAESR